MLSQEIDIKAGRLVTKDGRTIDQIYKGFQIYKSGKAPAEFTAIKEMDQYQGPLDAIKREIDKYWEKKDAEEVLKKKTGDAINEDKIITITKDSLDPDETSDIRNIEQETIANDYFRKVLFTAERMQLVLMSLKPGEEIGEEVHPTTDQFFRIEKGTGKSVIDGIETAISDGFTVIVKANHKHNIINTGKEALKLYSIYSPPKHQDGLIQKDKSTADE